MTAGKAAGPECECGEVVFDLTDKAPGTILCCPWCHKRYRLDDDETLTPLADPSDQPSEQEQDRPASGGERPASRARMPRPQDAATDPTAPLERISSRQMRRDAQRVSSEDGADAPPQSGRSPSGDASDPTESLNRTSRRARWDEPVLGEDGQPIDEWSSVKPLDLEKWVFRAALGMVPVGTLAFMGWVIYGVYSGQRDFVTYTIFGLTIRGDNPWVWFGGILLGGLVFLGMWVGYVYFFVHKKKLAEMEKKRRKKQDAGGSASGRRSTRRVGDPAEK
jgi:hypothetical protein